MLNQTDYIYSNPESEQPEGNNLIPFINYQSPAPKRCLDMLLAKYKGERYQSEVIMTSPEASPVPRLRCRMSEATILLITDGGLVPKGNPGKIPSTNAGRYGVYSIEGKKSLISEEYEVSHQGYDNTYVEEDPNRLLPVDILREMEAEGRIGKLYDVFLSTAGVMTSAERSVRLGRQIAAFALSHFWKAVDGAKEIPEDTLKKEAGRTPLEAENERSRPMHVRENHGRESRALGQRKWFRPQM